MTVSGGIRGTAPGPRFPVNPGARTARGGRRRAPRRHARPARPGATA